MGFGLLALGYLTVLGALPTSFIYGSYTIVIPIVGGAIMFAAFRKLQVYNIYFKAVKYICAAYIAVIAGLAPFLIIYQRGMPEMLVYISKAASTLSLFAFHFFLLTAMYSLAKEIDNPKVKRTSKRNIYITYFYFSLSVATLFPLGGMFSVYLQLFAMIVGIIYYILILINIYSCYMRITTE